MAISPELQATLLKSMDLAVAELMSLKKGEVSFSDTKIGDGDKDGSLPGDTSSESALKAEKPEDKEDEKEDDKEDEKEPEDKEDEEEDEDMSDEDAQKMEEKLSKWKAKKAMSKSESIDPDLIKSIAATAVQSVAKSLEDRLVKMEDLVNRIKNTPAQRKSVTGAVPLAKSEDEFSSQSRELSKAETLDKLFEMQKSGNQRVDSTVIFRVERGDYSVLSEKGIILK